ncbi:hypothetical protein D3C85_934840 [compost metagenome]
MQAGEAGFADGIQPRHIGTAVFIDEYSTAGVVRGRHDRDRLRGDVDAERQAALVHRREVALDEVGWLVADVQVDTVHAQAFHLMVDGPGDDVPWCQFGAGIEARHEALAVGQLEQAAFAAYRFGDQETLGLWVIQAGGVELVELQVRHPAAGSPGHGNAITAGAIGVTGIEIDLGGATGGQHGETCTAGIDLTGGAVEHISAQATVLLLAEAARCDQVHGDALFQ